VWAASGYQISKITFLLAGPYASSVTTALHSRVAENGMLNCQSGKCAASTCVAWSRDKYGRCIRSTESKAQADVLAETPNEAEGANMRNLETLYERPTSERRTRFHAVQVHLYKTPFT
jgi:hypothetical protein